MRALESVLGDQAEATGPLSSGLFQPCQRIATPLRPDNSGKVPTFQLAVEELVTEEIISRLKRDELDAAVLVTPLNDPGLQEFPFFYEPLWVYLPDGHQLLTQKRLSPADLPRNDLLLLSEGHCFRSQMLEVCRQRKGKRQNLHFNFESGSFEALQSLVDGGVGYTILPQLAVDRLITAKGRKRLRPFASPEPVREVSLVRSRLFTKKTVADTIANLIQAANRDNFEFKPAKHSIVPVIPALPSIYCPTCSKKSSVYRYCPSLTLSPNANSARSLVIFPDSTVSTQTRSSVSQN